MSGRPLLALLSVALAVACVLPALAGAQEAARLTIDQVVHGDGGATAYVSVLDGAGRPVEGVTVFAATVDGATVEVTSSEPVVSEQTGLSVLLAIDGSGSMTGEPIAQARQAARGFVQGLLGRDTAAVVSFAGAVETRVDYTTSRSELVSAVDALAPELDTGTALYDAAAHSLELSAGAPSPRRAIVFLTDGKDSGDASEVAAQAALDLASAAGVPVYAVGLGPDADASFLEALAERSGGAYFSAPAAGDVRPIFDAISAALRGQYAVDLRLPDGAQGDLTLRIEAVVPGAPAGETSLRVPGPTASGSNATLLIVVGAGAALAVACVVVLRFVRRPSRSPVPGGVGAERPLPHRGSSSPRGEANEAGRVAVIAGPDAGAVLAVGYRPLEVGSGTGCDLRLAPAGRVAERHARVWVRGGKLVVHHLGLGADTLVGGEPVDWVTLAADESFRIGPHVLQFLAGAEEHRPAAPVVSEAQSSL